MPAPAIERAAGGPRSDEAIGRRRAQLVQGIARRPRRPSRPVAGRRGGAAQRPLARCPGRAGGQVRPTVRQPGRGRNPLARRGGAAAAGQGPRAEGAPDAGRGARGEPEAAGRRSPAGWRTTTSTVARPVLERSPVLGDAELGEIVRTHAMQYALAVAGREHLSEFLSDTLAETGDAEVVARLVGNAGAQISVATLQRVAADYREDAGVQERLIRRPGACPTSWSTSGRGDRPAARMGPRARRGG